ncbi:MAG: glycosyltransferase family 4 protein [Anaerolineae bacterium]
MKLLYCANIRLPTEKAHGLQIMQNCEAFAGEGVEVRLWVARRVNTPAMSAVSDVWAHYGVRRVFGVQRIPCLDLLPYVPAHGLLTRIAFYLQQFTYTLLLFIAALFTSADVYYSRDALTILALSLIKPRRALAYEAHQLAVGRAGRWVQRQVVRRAGSVIAITPPLAHDLASPGGMSQPSAPGTPTSSFLVAHDGIRRQRFASMPSQAEARAALGWPADAFIIGYVGRLQTLSADKGVGTLVEALQHTSGVSLAIVGGPDDMAEALRQHWLKLGLPAANFLYAGQVAPEQVPLCLSAFDVCAMPHPYTKQFANYTSPLKLFEYMACQRPIVASDLPGWADVISHEQTALLVPPSDASALAAAITRLHGDPALRQHLADAAYQRVMAHYTWDARARAILGHLRRTD